jgi:pimeloyl-ACP methyl ester carboxylesterase
VPTLLLTGKHSALIRPARARACARLMPRAQAEIVTAAGHGPSIEQADHVNARITALIAAASKDWAR